MKTIPWALVTMIGVCLPAVASALPPSPASAPRVNADTAGPAPKGVNPTAWKQNYADLSHPQGSAPALPGKAAQEQRDIDRINQTPGQVVLAKGGKTADLVVESPFTGKAQHNEVIKPTISQVTVGGKKQEVSTLPGGPSIYISGGHAYTAPAATPAAAPK
jgi:hypothetical protein